MAAERVLIPSPVSVGGRSLIASPFQFQTGGEDLLRLRLWWRFPWGILFNAPPAVTLQVRSVDGAGALQVGTTTYQMVTSAGTLTQFYPLAAGYLQTVALVWAGTDSFDRGPCYATVDLVRGTQAGAQLMIGQLLGGYVELGKTICWPGSPVMGPLEGAGYPGGDLLGAFAVGTEATWAPPAGTMARVRAVSGAFIASAVAGTRYPNLTATTVAGALAAVCPPSAGVLAGTGHRLTWAPGVAPLAVAGAVDYIMSMPELRVHNSESLVTVTRGLDPGDQWTELHVSYDMWMEAST